MYLLRSLIPLRWPHENILHPLRKHAYSNILKFYKQKRKIFRKKNLIFFILFAQNIDCGYSLEPPRRGGSNEYPQSMFLSRNKKYNVYYIGMFPWCLAIQCTPSEDSNQTERICRLICIFAGRKCLKIRVVALRLIPSLHTILPLYILM